MDFLNHTILTWTLVIPVLGALVMLLAPGERVARWVALVFSSATFLVSLHLPAHFASASSGFQFEQNYAWIPAFHIQYHLGVDGLSLWLVVLAAFLSVIAVLASWKQIQENGKAFFLLLMLLEAGMIGVFISLDLFLFYLFWEVMLIPMVLMIGGWGHSHSVRASVKFFLYTVAGSLLMLAAILWLYTQAGTFDYVAIRQALAAGTLHLSASAEVWLFLGFLIAFAIKVPLFPFHTWQPDAYSEASTGGSILVAGVLSKMGVYGMLRFCLGLFPHAAHRFAPLVITLALIAIIYGGLIAFVQTDIKRLIAYSSLSHMGFIVLGIFTFTEIGTQGAIYQMLAHGVTIAGLYLLVGILYERRQSFALSEYGGVATAMPVFAGFFVLLVMASAGLPLLNGFVGEFLIMLGAFAARPLYGVVAAVGVILVAMYLLNWTRDILWGEARTSETASLTDVDGREKLMLVAVGVLAVVMGMAPRLFLRDMAATTRASVASLQQRTPSAPASVPAQAVQATTQPVALRQPAAPAGGTK